MLYVYLKIALFLVFLFLFFLSTGLWHWAWFGRGRGKSGEFFLRTFPFFAKRVGDDPTRASRFVEIVSTWMVVVTISCLGIVTYLLIS
ncbi:MAG: hypothetical protein B5M56_07360 [Desulfococcus sp. 4484_241]|nr:MAG: hypothetical protein B5M56_07360 [Desulfococcus sp. 4484_241]